MSFKLIDDQIGIGENPPFPLNGMNMNDLSGRSGCLSDLELSLISCFFLSCCSVCVFYSSKDVLRCSMIVMSLFIYHLAG